MPDAAAARRAFELLEGIYKDLSLVSDTLSCILGGPLCAAACGRCCQQPILITDIAAQYIVLNMRTLPPERQLDIKNRLEQWLLFDIPGVRPKFSNDGRPDEEALRNHEYDLVSRLWCPFMEEDKRCSIYPWRDITCRAWGVTRPAAAFCQRPLGKDETGMNRNYVTCDNHTVQGVQHQIAMLRGLLEDFMPGALTKGWVPFMVFRLLDGKRLDQIKGKIQEAKVAAYAKPVNPPVITLGILTKEQADAVCEFDPNFLEQSIKIE
jgi:Fe-S-cluster containining protein